MSKEVQESLDYPSKLSREPGLIHKLMADGERQGKKLLAGLSGPAHTVEEALQELRKEGVRKEEGRQENFDAWG